MKNKLYYTLDQLMIDLPSLKDTEITIVSDFEKTIKLSTMRYKSLLNKIKKTKYKNKEGEC